MKVILTQDVPKLGKRGTIVDVSDGHARNFLFVRKLAVEATKENIENEKNRLKNIKLKEERLLAEAQELAKKLEENIIKLKSKAGENGKLYGTVTNKEIAQAIKEQLNHEIDKKKIHINEHIKTLGNYTLEIKLHPQVIAKLRLQVEELK
ncbi:MAG: 50S ribosomal protein L9 [Candidatus Sericytochromatia bacterium]|nr:MAG: 50S ribosomal protein L9 [Candidatus Sericytochromatia bacterium]